MKMRVAVLISGRGSNLEALLKASLHEDFPAKIVLVISDQPDAGGLALAAAAGVDTAVIDCKVYGSKEEFESAIDDALKASKVDLICLAGFMRILSSDFVKRRPNRILNIHPSLLPAFKGLDTHRRALEAGVRFTGCTVHFVRPELDAGPIIIQAVVPISPLDTVITLSKKVLAQEHVIYPEALRLVASGQTEIRGDGVIISLSKTPEKTLTNPLVNKYF